MERVEGPLRVLLLGEYSGVHSCLRDGLRQLSVDADVASDGDAWKGFPRDLDFASAFGPRSLFGRVIKNVKPFTYLPQVRRYDLVQFVSPMILTPQLGVNTLFVELALRNAKRSFMLAAGDDAFYYHASKSFRYRPLDDYRAIDLAGGKTPWQKPGLIRLNQRVVDRVEGILPVAYDYWVGYSNNPKCHPVIPMPVDTSRYPYGPNNIQSRIVFYHGINRPGFKGSKYILEAFDRMRTEHAADAEFIVADRVPVNEYLDVLRGVNVLVDQSLSYSYGMNAIIAMAMGRIVMSGAEPETLATYGGSHCPVINITPDATAICERIRWIIENREAIPALGLASRKFVEDTHSHTRVAGEFLRAWMAR